MSTSPVVLRTARLTLRPLQTGDAPWITEGISDWEVIRWLTTPPWPYAVTDAVSFIDSEASAGAMAILVGDQRAGVVHINPSGDLGYWLVRPLHGLGYMTEAAGALVSDHIRRGAGQLVSGYVEGNAASRNVLTKLGFRVTHTINAYCRPRAADVTVVRMALPPAPS